MTNTPSKQIPTTIRRLDCVTEAHMGNITLTISGCFKRDATGTAADKMARAKVRCQHHLGL